ncbi:MAG: hypothetical protein C0622_01695 [Desulfuromonas sp.]|nr:MAG: hypothetical protein C0622_01695 [Desulfuromonas sp.]
MTDSIENRINLAQAYFNVNKYQESIDLLEKSLTGIHSNDLTILEGLCHSHFRNETYDEALKYLDKYEKSNESSLPNNLRLLKAKAYEAKGDIQAAIAEYDVIADICAGEEARCNYAVLLKKQGNLEKAKELFETILKNAELYPKHYKKHEKEWVDIAKAERI